MALFGWFDASEVDAFGREIGAEFSRHYPLASLPAGRDAEQKLLRAIEILGNRAAKFNREKRMGWYRKARFMRAVKEEMISRGGAEALADRVVYAVVVRMAR